MLTKKSTGIDNDSFEYSTSPEAEANFSNRTKNSWDSFEDSSSYRLVCPKCLHPHEVAWTGWDDSAAWHKSKTNDFDGDAIASGYADKEFFFVCNGKRMTHDTLRASKFWRNCKTLNQDDVPMQGTCLDSNGKCLRSIANQCQNMTNGPLVPNVFARYAIKHFESD